MMKKNIVILIYFVLLLGTNSSVWASSKCPNQNLLGHCSDVTDCYNNNPDMDLQPCAEFACQLDIHEKGCCEIIPIPACDYDGDGYESEVDCDDMDPGIYPNAPKICNGKDNDCDGWSDGVSTMTIRGGGEPARRKKFADLQIMVNFTGLDGCIVDYTEDSITVHSGTTLAIDCYRGYGPDPTAIWLDNVRQPVNSDGLINCPDVTVEGGNVVLRLTNKRRTDTPPEQLTGSDTDSIVIKVVP